MKPVWTAQHPGNGTHKFLTRSGLRGDQVKGPMRVFVFQEKAERANVVCQMDPGHSLLAVTEFSAEKQPRRKNHEGKHTTSRGQDHRTADDDATYTEPF